MKEGMKYPHRGVRARLHSATTAATAATAAMATATTTASSGISRRPDAGYRTSVETAGRRRRIGGGFGFVTNGCARRRRRRRDDADADVRCGGIPMMATTKSSSSSSLWMGNAVSARATTTGRMGEWATTRASRRRTGRAVGVDEATGVGVGDGDDDDDARGGASGVDAEEEERRREEEAKKKKAPVADRGLGQRRALSAETRSRPFVPLKGEVLHIAWYREYDETGKFTREEGLAYRECIEDLLSHYTMPLALVQETLDGIERGWSDVTLDLGAGYNLRMQRHTEFETLTLNGPGNMKAPLDTPMKPWEWLLPAGWLEDIPGKVFLVNHAEFRQLAQPIKNEEPTLKELTAIRSALRSKSPITLDSQDDSLLEWDSGSLVGCGIGDGSRLFVNYELDESGGMQTLVIVPPGNSTFIRAGRQLQRFFALEQYRLLILQRLPSAKSKFPLLAGLNERYEALTRELRRSRATSRGHKEQQNFVTQITELEQAITQLVTRTKLVALTAQSYLEIVDLRLSEAAFTRLGYEIRFLPLFVKKRIDPAVSTINAVAEQALILSDSLERTTSLVQASVEVRLQRINERIATYGLLFTIASVLVSFVTSIQPNGSLHWLYVIAKAKWMAFAAAAMRLFVGAA